MHARPVLGALRSRRGLAQCHFGARDFKSGEQLDEAALERRRHSFRVRVDQYFSEVAQRSGALVGRQYDVYAIEILFERWLTRFEEENLDRGIRSYVRP